MNQSGYQFGAAMVLRDCGLLKCAAEDLGERADALFKATPDQAQRYAGLQRRLVGGGLGLSLGGALGGGVGLAAENPRLAALLALLGGGGGGALGAAHPGLAGALGGIGMGGGLGAAAGAGLGYALGGEERPKVITGLGALGALAGAIPGGYLGYRALRE